MYLGGPVAPSCTINKTKSSSSYKQLELVLFHYLCHVIPGPTGHPNVILISIHVNAAGDGTKWMNATGWSCYTCKGQTESGRLADCLYKAAEQILKNQIIRTDYARDGDFDWEENIYILRHTLCPAVLIENFFMDNLQNRDYLLSEEGIKFILQIFLGVVPVCFLKNWTKAEGLEKLSLSEISWTVRSVVLRSIFASINTAS